jgi:hypothetical protein
MLNTKDSSNILLLCLGLDTNKKEAKKATVTDLYEVFKKYGELKKIMIFSKKNILKGFLEYSSKEEADLAVKETHDIFLGKYGKCRVYCSDLQTLTGTKFLEFWENGVNIKRSPFEDVSNQINNICPQTPQIKNHLKEEVENKSIERNPNKQREFNISSFSRSIKKNSLNHSSNTENSFSGKRNTVGYPFKEKPSFFQSSGFKFGQEKRDSVWRPRQSEKIILQKGSNFKKEDSVEMEDIKPFKTNMTPSKVVLISNLLNIFDSSKEVFNLFSCFGDIVKILLMKNLHKVMIEYDSLEGSKNCIANINNLQIEGTTLRVNYSKYPSIDLKKNNRSENSVHFNDVFIPNGLSKFSESDEEKFENCSEKILISTKKTEALKPLDVYLFIKEKGKPISIKLIKNKEQKDIIELELTYDQIQKAIMTMIKFHNFKLKDSILTVKFVK